MVRSTTFALAALVAAGCAGGIQGTRTGAPTPADARVRAARAELRRVIDSMIGTPQFRNAHWGILIVDPKSGDTLYSHNAGKLFMPASNQKLLTGATALARLGPEYRFRTEFAVRWTPSRDTAGGRGSVRDGVLQGDLVVIGHGDPTMSDHMLGDAMIPLRAAADSLAARGVRRVAGQLVRGGDAFPDANYGFGWAWDDFDYPYSAGVDELLFNEGFTRVTVRGGARAGERPVVTVAPGRTFPEVRVAAITVAVPEPRGAGDAAADSGVPALTNVSASAEGVGGPLVVTGTIAAGDSTTVSIAHRDPGGAYLAAAAQALEERGIALDRGVGILPLNPLTGTLPGGARLDTLFAVLSPPLRDILPALEKPSQNQIAEVLLKTLGAEETGVGTADSGRRVIEAQLVDWGADPEGFAVRDGSGLSRHNYVSPETIVRVLDAMRRDPSFAVFYDALPVAGVDGTIAGRMRGTPAQGNVHAKTGFVDKARSLSGYVTSADGELLLFSLLCNNWTTPVRAVERVQDEIAVRLAALAVNAR
jgi:D-alanyl-D-alanine carboxypeptidase/D-alanyl-D-alanine-endopeptidase (penicillin-binding protein 4)